MIETISTISFRGAIITYRRNLIGVKFFSGTICPNCTFHELIFRNKKAPRENPRGKLADTTASTQGSERFPDLHKKFKRWNYVIIQE